MTLPRQRLTPTEDGRGVYDRNAALRSQPEALRRAWQHPETGLLLIDGDRVPVRPVGDDTAESPVTLALLPCRTDHGAEQPMSAAPNTAPSAAPNTAPSAAPSPGNGGSPSDLDWYGGRWGDRHVFVRPVESQGASGEPGMPRTDVPPGAEWQPLTRVAARLSQGERDLAAAAVALGHWHASAGYSPRDGSPTRVAQAGWARVDAHGAEHFPRTDPAVIVRIEHEDRVLLGSNILWPAGRFSLLAGFVEAGESIEDAVRREVFEESGLRVGSLEFLVSQPWPFPRSLMLGFRATLADGQDPLAMVPDPTEITELRWFTRDEVAHPPAGITTPSTASLAGRLLAAWVEAAEPPGRAETAEPL